MVRAGMPIGLTHSDVTNGAWRLIGLASTLLALILVN
jgi:hypothetical protein